MTQKADSPPRTVYLAGRWSRRDELEGHARVLGALGVRVTSRWLTDPNHRANIRDDDQGAQAFNAMLACHDWDDVHDADALIYFSPGGSRGGCHVEFGIALAIRRRVILVGPREHVFTWMASVERYPDWAACLEEVFGASPVEVGA